MIKKYAIFGAIDSTAELCTVVRDVVFNSIEEAEDQLNFYQREFVNISLFVILPVYVRK